MKIKYILILFLGLYVVRAIAHEQIVHQEITANAETSAFAHSPAYADFINTVSSDRPRFGKNGLVPSMVAGSFDEDCSANEDKT